MSHKKRCLRLAKNLIKNHEKTWLDCYEAGYDDAHNGFPMQLPVVKYGAESVQAAVDFGRALYKLGYQAQKGQTNK